MILQREAERTNIVAAQDTELGAIFDELNRQSGLVDQLKSFQVLFSGTIVFSAGDFTSATGQWYDRVATKQVAHNLGYVPGFIANYIQVGVGIDIPQGVVPFNTWFFSNGHVAFYMDPSVDATYFRLSYYLGPGVFDHGPGEGVKFYLFNYPIQVA